MKNVIAVVTLLSLAACDDGGVIDQTVGHGVRQNAVQACTAWVPQSDVAVAAGIDGERLCACAVDRILEGKSVSNLPELRPGAAETRAAIAQCVAQLQSAPSETETN